MNAEGLNQAFTTASSCLAQYKLSLVYKIAGITAAATETYDSLVQKISNLIGLPTRAISIIQSSSSELNWFNDNSKRAQGNFTADILLPLT